MMEFFQVVFQTIFEFVFEIILELAIFGVIAAIGNAVLGQIVDLED